MENCGGCVLVGGIRMYECKDCYKRFKFPETRNIDAGHNVGILGFQVHKTIQFCPGCMSVNIKEIVVKGGMRYGKV